MLGQDQPGAHEQLAEMGARRDRGQVRGVGVGFVFAALVLAISVVSVPLLLDHNVGIDVAVSTSLRAVAANPGVMALWGAIIYGVSRIVH